VEVGAFLARYPPFDGLDAQALQAVAGQVRIEFFPAGATILEPEGPPASFLYVVRTGSVDVVDDGRVVDSMGEGETFGGLSMLGQVHPTATVRAEEDTICYLIPKDASMRALGTPGGAGFMGAVLRRWRARAASSDVVTGIERRAVGSMVRRSPVTCRPERSVADAARLMAKERVSCLLVEAEHGWGILTDRDLRSRVLAAGLDPVTPVSEVMTVPAVLTPTTAMAGEVLLDMLAGGRHHAPVADAEGRLVGVVTDTDLMGLERESPFALKSAIERAGNEQEAVEAAGGLPATVAGLVEASVDPVDIGHIVGLARDALTGRLAELAMGELGEPPVPWAWLALGSQARHEQALRTDQDHALAFDPGDHSREDVDPYFAELAARVTNGLEASGIPRCNGDAMAVNPALRRSVMGWAEAFRAWMNDPGIEGSILTSIVFDHRRVAGPLDPGPTLDRVVAAAADRYPQFLRHLARRALDRTPPTGFVRDFVVEAKGEHAGRLDVKHGGITIISNLARAYAIRAGRTEKRTLERLRAARESGQIDEDTRAALEEAFRLLWQIRLEHQAAQVRSGEDPDDFVDPRTLGPIARQGLKEAFRIVAREQRTLAADLGLP
jgi:CBS domain-containing protein